MENLKERYKAFSEELLHEYRYIQSDAAKKFLEDILAVADANFLLDLEKGTTLYRARLNDENRQAREISLSALPRGVDEMKPIPNVVSGGRVNAQNIAVLYTADQIGTALAEVRAAPEHPVTVGTFKTNRDLKLVDLSKRMDWHEYFFGKIIAKDFWIHLSHEFSVPTTPGMEYRHYVRTQVIAEYFKANGYDGIKYRSQFKAHEKAISEEPVDGFNYALFDIASADCIETKVYKTIAQHIVYTQIEEQGQQ